MRFSSINRPRFLSSCCALLIAAPLVGCGDGIDYAPVQGVVTSKNGPVEGLRIQFDPVSVEPGHASAGVTGSDGTFTLNAINGERQGAAVGKNRVVMSFEQPSDGSDELTPLPTREVPLKYRDGSTVFEVPAEGTTSADFQIKVKKRR